MLGRGIISSGSPHDRAVPDIAGFGYQDHSIEPAGSLVGKDYSRLPPLWGVGQFVDAIVFALVGMRLNLVG
jgi:hypothetical protein